MAATAKIAQGLSPAGEYKDENASEEVDGPVQRLLPRPERAVLKRVAATIDGHQAKRIGRVRPSARGQIHGVIRPCGDAEAGQLLWQSCSCLALASNIVKVSECLPGVEAHPRFYRQGEKYEPCPMVVSAHEKRVAMAFYTYPE